MQDVFIEYMVKQQKTIKTAILKILIAVGTIIFALAMFALVFSQVLWVFSFLAVILAVASFFGAYFLVTSLNLEFEYSITNGEMDVDKIIAQRKRQRLMSIKWRNVEGFGKYKPSEHIGKSRAQKIFACDSPKSDDLWYCITRVPQKGQVLLVFNANEKMLMAIKKYLPKPLLLAAFKKS